MVARRPRVFALGLAAASLAFGVQTDVATAQPTVRIQAGAQLELQGIESGTLRGRLADDLGRPLAGRNVVVDLRVLGEREWRRAAATTTHDGTFLLAVGVERGQVELAASYAGDRMLAPAREEGRFDAGLSPVRLELLGPTMKRVDIDDERFVLRIGADSSAGGAGLPISVHAASGAVLASGTTDARGHFERELLTSVLDPPGPHPLVVRSAGDATRGAAQLQQTVIAYVRTSLALHAEQDGERVVLAGVLATRRGPQARKAIGIYVDGAHLATVLTDASGQFRYAADAPPADVSAAGELTAQARFDSDEAWLSSSRSESVAVRWPQAGSMPSPAWLLVPTALCALLVIAWSARRAQAQATSAPLQVRGPGVHALGSRSRGRAAFDRIAGVVVDDRSGQPISNAVVMLEGPDGARLELAAEDSGRFATASLQAGQWRMTVLAPSYAAQQQELSIPHHGAWADVQVLLQSLRWAAVEAYRPAAERVLLAPHLWGQWTLREIRESATRSGRGGEELEHATALTELAAYGPEVPGEERVRAIEEASAQIGRRRSPRMNESG